MCNKAVCIDPYILKFVPDPFKMQGICNKAVSREPYTLRYVSAHLKTHEMCNKAVHIIFPYQYKTKGICNKAVRLITLRHKGCAHESFYDHFKTEDICACSHVVENKNVFFKEEFMPIAWDPSRYWDWCVSNNEKQETEIIFLTT